MTDPSDFMISTDLSASELAKLQMNARGYRFDATLDAAADLFHTDLEAWKRLPPVLQDYASIYSDFREYHRRAIAHGIIKEEDQQ